jgi:hypothetical protein
MQDQTTRPKIHLTAHPEVQVTENEELQILSTAKVRQLEEVILPSNTSTLLRVKATLRKTMAIHPRAKATHNNSPTVRVHHPSAHRRLWVHHPQCHPVGSSNGTRTASDGIM